jgi:hypothetical protein
MDAPEITGDKIIDERLAYLIQCDDQFAKGLFLSGLALSQAAYEFYGDRVWENIDDPRR